MASPARQSPPKASSIQRPTDALLTTQSTSNAITTAQAEQTVGGRKRRNHRAGKKKKNRRQSFAIGEDETVDREAMRSNPDLLDQSHTPGARQPFYRLGQSGGRNMSETSLDSQALLDHR